MIPVRVHTILISTQHSPDVTNDQIHADLMEHVIKPVVPAKYLDDKTIFHLNPSGAAALPPAARRMDKPRDLGNPSIHGVPFPARLAVVLCAYVCKWPAEQVQAHQMATLSCRGGPSALCRGR